MRWGSLCLRATRRSSGHIHRAVHILMRVRAANKAYFLRLAKSRCGMPARRAPNRLACVALHSVTVAIGLCSVRLPRMGATQYSRWTELHSLGATLLLAPAYVRLPLRLSHLAPEADLQPRMVRTAVFSGTAPHGIASVSHLPPRGRSGRLGPSPGPSDALGSPV